MQSKKENENHEFKKRNPLKLPKRKIDVYVNNKTDFRAQLNKCEKLLEADAKEIIIHGLGAAINKAVNLALHLQDIHCGTLGLDIKTSTVDLVDDLEPLNDDVDYEVNERKNSAIHIRVFRTVLFKSLSFEKEKCSK